MTSAVVYARFSSEMQRDTSIEDQVRRCREFALRQGWSVVREYADRAISGAALAGRDQLEALMQAAREIPRPFDRVLVYATSRLGRNLPEFLTLVERLKYLGVFVNFISQSIDSATDSSRLQLAVNGMMDEHYLAHLAEQVHRGAEGQALKGLNPGGKCYGYLKVPIENPSKLGKYGRATVLGVKLEIIEKEAEVVRRIFALFSGGAGLGQIAKKLNAEGILAPQPPRNRAIRAWCPSSIRSMLRNEKYRGVLVWNRTKKQRNPETGRKTSRPRPESDVKRIEVPDWRIVSEELWIAAQARFRNVREVGVARSGGFARSASSRKYLFSGLLRCGCCQAHMVIVSGQGKRGYSKYGCPSHWGRGVCANRLTIRRDRLESQLLAALQERIWKPTLLDYAITSFEQEVRRRIAETRKKSDEQALSRERDKLRSQAQRIAEAIAQAEQSPTLLQKLRGIEAQIEEIDRRRDIQRAASREPSFENLRRFVLERASFLAQLARSDPERAKAAFSRHLQSIVLTPTLRDTGPVFEVSGSWNLIPKDDAMVVVARDGIEPPTPAFSGLRSFSLLAGNGRGWQGFEEFRVRRIEVSASVSVGYTLILNGPIAIVGAGPAENTRSVSPALSRVGFIRHLFGLEPFLCRSQSRRALNR